MMSLKLVSTMSPKLVLIETRSQLEDRGNTALLGSVVRLDVGGWNGVMAGVEEDWGTAEVPTVARELVGLPLLGRSKPRLWGELGLETTLMALVLA